MALVRSAAAALQHAARGVLRCAVARRTPFSVGRTAAAPLGAERLAAGRRAFGDDLKTACGTFALTESQFHDVGGRMIARIQDGIELRLEELDVDFTISRREGRDA